MSSGQALAQETGDPVVNEIIVRGIYKLTPDEIKYRMGTREGEVFNKQVLDEDFERLRAMGEFADVQFKIEDVPGRNRINIIVLLREKSIIRRITFLHDGRTRLSHLEDQVQSKVGELYDAGQVARDARAIEDFLKGKSYYFAVVEPEVEPFEDGVRLVFDVQEGGKLYVRGVIFRGNYHFRDKTLLKFMQTKPSNLFSIRQFDRQKFEQDLERVRLFYQGHGYLDVQVTERPFQVTANTPTGRFGRRDAYVYIDIDEGAQYRVGSVSFEGNGLVSDDDLRAVIETMPGQVYSPIKVEEDCHTIRDIYGLAPSSRYFTRVTGDYRITEADYIVNVVFSIEESPQIVIEDVEIIGNDVTKDNVYRRELTFFPGENIDSKKINESERNLRNLDYFHADSFRMNVREGSTPERGVVTVRMEEKETGQLSFGVGFSSSETMMGMVSIEQRNFDYAAWPESFREFITGKSFRGAGQYFRGSASMGTRSKNFGLDWNNPWIFDRPISWGFGAYYRTYEWDQFTDERIGGYTSIGRRLFNQHLTGSVTYRLERVNMYNVHNSASRFIHQEKGVTLFSRMAFALNWDNTDNRFDPTRGLKVNNTFELVGGILGGDKDFWSNNFKVAQYAPIYIDKDDRPYYLMLGSEFATMDRFGSTKEIPVYERLYAGGIGTVRGWDHRRLGPRDGNSVIGGYSRQTNQVEFFAPVYEDMVKMSVFYDVGGVWADPWSISGGQKAGRSGGSGYRHSTGVGLHVKTPLSPMPVRIYYTQYLNKYDRDETSFIQFTFGAQF